jgi:hypothetical protein
MMNKLLLSIALVLLLGFVPDRLKKIKVADGITVSLPEELKPMTPEDIAIRYPSVRAPLAAFTDANRSLDFSVNVSATQWPDANLELASKFFKAGITNLYDRVDFINEGVHSVHRKKFIFFEFESRINGNKLVEGEQQPIYRYTYIQYLVEPGRTLVISFNCPKGMREEWEQTIHHVMKSVRIR